MYHYVALLQAGFTSCGCQNSEMFVQLNWQAVTSAASPCVDQKWSSLALRGDAALDHILLAGDESTNTVLVP